MSKVNNKQALIHSSVILYVFIIFSFTIKVEATPITGDIELLKIVANGYKANYDRINTMRGTANINSTFKPSDDEMVANVVEADFVADRDLDAYRWHWNPVETSITTGGIKKSSKDYKSLSESIANGMLNGNSVYRFRFREPKPDGTRQTHVLTIRPLANEGLDIAMSNESFNPYYFFQAVYPDIYSRIMWYYENASNPKLVGGKVFREGDFVVFETGTEDSAINRYTFDLSKGCNLVKYYGGDSMVKSSWEFHVREDNGIYVPEKLIHNKITNREAEIHNDSTEVQFTELKVNSTIHEEEFSIEKLGIQTGDLIDDMKVGLSYVYGIGLNDKELRVDKVLEDIGAESANRLKNTEKTSEKGDQENTVQDNNIEEGKEVTNNPSVTQGSQQQNDKRDSINMRFLAGIIITIMLIIGVYFIKKG